jgi:4-diphosphocytidyl-2-C-methyl-D-erythritol kinase
VAIVSLHDLPAPAKLNLHLRLVGRRADGYHLLESRMVFLDWSDTLHVERRAGGAVSREDVGGEDGPLPADDLVVRAARALQRASGTDLGAHVVLEKRVPSGAGLGGGSSDAATALLALNRLWGLDWPLERLLPLGLALGADVPFFLGGRASDVAGIGERLAPVGVEPAWFAVVRPTVALQTADVFRAAARIAGFSSDASSGKCDGREGNDLEAAALAVSGAAGGDLAEAFALWRETFGTARMTGSGSAIFAPVEGPEAALPPLPHGWRARVCRSFAAHPLLGWAGEDEV